MTQSGHKKIVANSRSLAIDDPSKLLENEGSRKGYQAFIGELNSLFHLMVKREATIDSKQSNSLKSNQEYMKEIQSLLLSAYKQSPKKFEWMMDSFLTEVRAIANKQDIGSSHLLVEVLAPVFQELSETSEGQKSIFNILKSVFAPASKQMDLGDVEASFESLSSSFDIEEAEQKWMAYTEKHNLPRFEALIKELAPLFVSMGEKDANKTGKLIYGLTPFLRKATEKGGSEELADLLSSGNFIRLLFGLSSEESFHVLTTLNKGMQQRHAKSDDEIIGEVTQNITHSEVENLQKEAKAILQVAAPNEKAEESEVDLETIMSDAFLAMQTLMTATSLSHADRSNISTKTRKIFISQAILLQEMVVKHLKWLQEQQDKAADVAFVSKIFGYVNMGIEIIMTTIMAAMSGGLAAGLIFGTIVAAVMIGGIFATPAISDAFAESIQKKLCEEYEKQGLSHFEAESMAKQMARIQSDLYASLIVGGASFAVLLGTSPIAGRVAARGAGKAASKAAMTYFLKVAISQGINATLATNLIGNIVNILMFQDVEDLKDNDKRLIATIVTMILTFAAAIGGALILGNALRKNMPTTEDGALKNFQGKEIGLSFYTQFIRVTALLMGGFQLTNAGLVGAKGVFEKKSADIMGELAELAGSFTRAEGYADVMSQQSGQIDQSGTKLLESIKSSMLFLYRSADQALGTEARLTSNS